MISAKCISVKQGQVGLQAHSAALFPRILLPYPEISLVRPTVAVTVELREIPYCDFALGCARRLLKSEIEADETGCAWPWESSRAPPIVLLAAERSKLKRRVLSR